MHRFNQPLTPKTNALLILAFLLSLPLHGEPKQSHSIILGFLQLKEGFNLGMVFNGVQLEYRYGVYWDIGKNRISCEPKIMLGVGFNRGMIGANINIVPLDVSWLRTFYEGRGHSFRAGGNFAADYSYQMYPHLHSGHLFWMSEIGISPLLEYSYQWERKRIELHAKNSFLGFVSHTQENDPYFYSFKVGDFFTRPHQDMRFGSFNNYNHSVLSLEFTPDVLRAHSFLLGLDYLGSYYGTRFERLNYNVQWKISY